MTDADKLKILIHALHVINTNAAVPVGGENPHMCLKSCREIASSALSRCGEIVVRTHEDRLRDHGGPA